MTDSAIYNREKLDFIKDRESIRNASDEDIDALVDWANSLKQSEGIIKDLRLEIINQFTQHLKDANITSGKIAEIGGPYNSYNADFPDFEFEYLSLYPVEGRDDVVVADITQCDYVKSKQYDAIFSVSVLEHVAKPWLAAAHMSRLLKPGGIMYHCAPFSYFYHGAPADFWRYTPDAFKMLFSDLEPLRAEFFGDTRRRDNRGSKACAVDRDGGAPFAVDAFGGWRENWFTMYCGRKNADYLKTVQKNAEKQAIINLMKCATMSGLNEDEALRLVCRKIKTHVVSRDGELSKVPSGQGMNYTKDQVLEFWKTRSKKTLMPSYSRFVQGKKTGIL